MSIVDGLKVCEFYLCEEHMSDECKQEGCKKDKEEEKLLRRAIKIARNWKRQRDGNDRIWKMDIADIENVMIAKTRALSG